MPLESVKNLVTVEGINGDIQNQKAIDLVKANAVVVEKKAEEEQAGEKKPAKKRASTKKKAEAAEGEEAAEKPKRRSSKKAESAEEKPRAKAWLPRINLTVCFHTNQRLGKESQCK